MMSRVCLLVVDDYVLTYLLLFFIAVCIVFTKLLLVPRGGYSHLLMLTGVKT